MTTTGSGFWYPGLIINRYTLGTLVKRPVFHWKQSWWAGYFPTSTTLLHSGLSQDLPHTDWLFVLEGLVCTSGFMVEMTIKLRRPAHWHCHLLSEAGPRALVSVLAGKGLLVFQ